MPVKLVSRQIGIFIVPLLVLAAVLAPTGELWVFILFALMTVFYSFAVPYVCGVLPKDNVDVVYYLIAIIGVILFFYAEHISDKEYELRNQISSNKQLLADTEDILEDLDAYLDRPDIRDFVRSQLLGIVEDYKVRFEARVDECSVETGADHDFCEYMLANYQVAVSIFESGDLRGQRAGPRSTPSLPMNRAQELFFDRSVTLILPGNHANRGGSLVVPAISVWEMLFRRVGRDQSRPDTTKARSEITSAVQGFFDLGADATERRSKELDQATEYGHIPWLALLTQNIWSYLLVAALGMKLARSKVELF